MPEATTKAGACPVCGKPVDPLRAGAVGIFGGSFVYFCSDACRAAFGGSSPSRPSGPSPQRAAAGLPPVEASRPSPGASLPEPALPAAASEAPAAEEALGEPEPFVAGVEPEPEERPARISLPSYGLAPEAAPERPGHTATALFVYLLLLGAFMGLNLARRWAPWIQPPAWLADAAAGAGAALLGLCGLLDLFARRWRGIDHLVVGTTCAALMLWSVLGGSPEGTPYGLAVLALYCAATVAERRWIAQRPPPVAPVQGGPRADGLVDWGGARGPIVRGLRRALAIFPVLPAAAALGALGCTALAGIWPTADFLVPILVGCALAFVPWSVRHAAAGFGELARAASAANVRYLDPASVERAAKVHHVVFLYRGVVTQGRPEVVEFVNYSDQPDAVIFDLVASAEQAAGGSKLAEALLAFTEGRGAAGEATTRLSRFWPGHGVKATSARGEVWIGSRRMLLEEGVSTGAVEEEARHYERNGWTVLFIAIRRRVHALVALADPIRSEMSDAVEELHRVGLETHLLTGESRLTAEQIARSVRVRHIRPELARDERAGEIRGLREMGAAVAVVGRPADASQVIQDADVAVALGVRDPQGYPCEVAASSEDPRVAVASLAAARRAVSAVVTHAVAAGAIALLTAGFSALGFLPPPATIGLVALTALAPLRRRGGRSAFAALEGKG